MAKNFFFCSFVSTDKNKKSIEDVPEMTPYHKKNKRPTGSPDGGGRSLNNWKFRMDERRQVMNTMSSRLLQNMKEGVIHIGDITY